MYDSTYTSIESDYLHLYFGYDDDKFMDKIAGTQSASNIDESDPHATGIYNRVHEIELMDVMYAYLPIRLPVTLGITVKNPEYFGLDEMVDNCEIPKRGTVDVSKSITEYSLGMIRDEIESMLKTEAKRSAKVTNYSMLDEGRWPKMFIPMIKYPGLAEAYGVEMSIDPELARKMRDIKVFGTSCSDDSTLAGHLQSRFGSSIYYHPTLPGTKMGFVGSERRLERIGSHSNKQGSAGQIVQEFGIPESCPVEGCDGTKSHWQDGQ